MTAKLASWKELSEKRAQALAVLLKTEAGRTMLDDLEGAFNKDDLLGEDDREMHFNLGARAVYLHLRRIQRSTEGTGNP